MQTVRLTSDGAAARPEILFADGRFYIVYLSYIDPRQREIRLRVFDADLAFTGSERVLVPTDVEGWSPTDYRIFTDGQSIFAAWEMVQSEAHRLYLARYDLDYELIEGPILVAEAEEPAAVGDEHFDDPTLTIVSPYIYLITHLEHCRSSDLQFHVRKYSYDDLSQPLEERDIGTGDLLPLKHGQHAVVFDSGSSAFYLVTTFMHEDPTKSCPVFPPGSEANPGIALHEYDASWNYQSSQKLVDGPEDEMGPKGFQSDGSKFYLGYRVVERFEREGRAAYAEGRLVVFDAEFNLLQDLWLTDPDDSLYLRDHISLTLAGGRIYAAYAYGSAEQGGNRDVFVNVYEWR
ncbi:MAG: hypothetical protein ACE5LQ_00705 [Candidatus Bipolaricaulia bacterium]